MRRLLYLGLGFASLALGALGAVLPLLPTVPFVLLAAFFFARSSPALEARLLDNPRFGPHIRAWRERGAIRPAGKRAALTAFAFSAIVGARPPAFPLAARPARGGADRRQLDRHPARGVTRRPCCARRGTMPVRALFPTFFYEDSLEDPTLLAGLDEACRALAGEDRAGRRWSREHGYRGYTSYASLNDLPARDPRFAELVRHLNRHVAGFAAECAFDLAGRRLKLDSLWVNILRPGGSHSGHIHPHSVVSGTLYVAVPPGSGRLKLEDPRLPMMMAAPPRRADAREDLQTFVYAEPDAGRLFLWESWLRHEVEPSSGKSERISISFNYRL